MTRRYALGLVAALLALVVTACAGGGGVVEVAIAPAPSVESAGVSEVEVVEPEPAGVEIPKIAAASTLVPLGLNPDRTVRVPPVEQPMQAGWYSDGPRPGEVGPSVILGHVDGGGLPGIFHRLRELAEGDEILVSRVDGSTVTFVVRKVEQVAKSEFPTDRVYGDTDEVELRLITCGGQFDAAARSYRDNIIVYATHQP